MIKLYGKVKSLSPPVKKNVILAITSNPNLPVVLQNKKALITDSNILQDFKVVLYKKTPTSIPSENHHLLLPENLHYLDDGDVVRINLEDGTIRVLFRNTSSHNSILLTERCNHYCLMCSQPPKNIDDSWILDETKELIKLIPDDTEEIGFTGGEPTLYGEKFIDLMHLTAAYLPRTAIHILSNGRSFHSPEFTRAYAQVQHDDMMLGIPLYSDDPVRHDYVVQSKNAFNETVRGILNLKSFNMKVEIRVVIHKQTIERLVNLCEFIVRNLLFVDHVALMGLEITGFTRANLDSLWIDPYDYKDTLSDAVNILESYGMNVSVYNHQRCLVNQDIMRAYRKSISDWKNEYLEECTACSKVSECGGLFLSGKQYKYSEHIKAFN